MSELMPFVGVLVDIGGAVVLGAIILVIAMQMSNERW
jgi:hypothetical protein